MKIPSKTDRIEFWKFAYARSSFVETIVFAEYLLASNVRMEDLLRRAFSFAIITSYARPFKQREAVRLPEDIVPPANAKTHGAIIEMRDQIVAHRDIDGPISKDVGLVNLIEVIIASGSININTVSPIMSDEKTMDVLKLSKIMKEKMEYHLDKYYQKLKPLILEHSDGNYLLSIKDNPKEWLIRQ